MYSLNQLKTLVSCGRDPARSLPFRRGFLLIPLTLVCFAFSVNAQPAPETPDPIFVNDPFGTADGNSALRNVNGGFGNSAFGWFSLFSDVAGSFNTGCGAGTLVLNNADSNTAVGTAALILNTIGTRNTAVGTATLVNNGATDNGAGDDNHAFGAFALNQNIDGFSNTGLGGAALQDNISGAENTGVGDLTLVNNGADGNLDANFNTAVGAAALFSNVSGDSNNAVGVDALSSNVDGLFNNAMGFAAMGDNISGAGNVAIGDSAGLGNTSGSFNIYIGVFSAAAPDGENDTIRIGDPGSAAACFVGGISGVPVVGDAVCVDGNGQLGSCGPASPGKTALQQLKATTERQAAVIALQEGQIKALTAGLKQQAEQIQKVSAQLEMIRPTPRVVENR